eukprot:g27834.t1
MKAAKLYKDYDSWDSPDIPEHTSMIGFPSTSTKCSLLRPLTRQLTNLAGNLWNASLQNKRAERNEFLLCHEFHRKKFVLPDKENAAQKKRRLTDISCMGMEDVEEDAQVDSAARSACYAGLPTP